MPEKEDPPPILTTWRRVYAVVLLWLAVQIAVYYAFTKVFD